MNEILFVLERKKEPFENQFETASSLKKRRRSGRIFFLLPLRVSQTASKLKWIRRRRRRRANTMPSRSRWLRPWSSLVEGDEGCIGPSGKLLCLWLTRKGMRDKYGIIPHMFDCWADHLLMLKSSMLRPFETSHPFASSTTGTLLVSA